MIWNWNGRSRDTNLHIVNRIFARKQISRISMSESGWLQLFNGSESPIRWIFTQKRGQNTLTCFYFKTRDTRLHNFERKRGTPTVTTDPGTNKTSTRWASVNWTITILHCLFSPVFATTFVVKETFLQEIENKLNQSKSSLVMGTVLAPAMKASSTSS